MSENIIETDLAAIKTVGGWVKRYPPIKKRVNIPGLLAEFSRTLYEEIDYTSTRVTHRSLYSMPSLGFSYGGWVYM
jgi:hypothetical protein